MLVAYYLSMFAIAGTVAAVPQHIKIDINVVDDDDSCKRIGGMFSSTLNSVQGPPVPTKRAIEKCDAEKNECCPHLVCSAIAGGRCLADLTSPPPCLKEGGM